MRVIKPSWSLPTLVVLLLSASTIAASHMQEAAGPETQLLSNQQAVPDQNENEAYNLVLNSMIKEEEKRNAPVVVATPEPPAPEPEPPAPEPEAATVTTTTVVQPEPVAQPVKPVVSGAAADDALTKDRAALETKVKEINADLEDVEVRAEANKDLLTTVEQLSAYNLALNNRVQTAQTAANISDSDIANAKLPKIYLSLPETLSVASAPETIAEPSYNDANRDSYFGDDDNPVFPPISAAERAEIKQAQEEVKADIEALQNEQGCDIRNKNPKGLNTLINKVLNTVNTSSQQLNDPKADQRTINQTIQDLTQQLFAVDGSTANRRVAHKLAMLGNMYREHRAYKAGSFIADESHYTHLRDFSHNVDCIVNGCSKRRLQAEDDNGATVTTTTTTTQPSSNGDNDTQAVASNSQSAEPVAEQPTLDFNPQLDQPSTTTTTTTTTTQANPDADSNSDGQVTTSQEPAQQNLIAPAPQQNNNVASEAQADGTVAQQQPTLDFNPQLDQPPTTTTTTTTTTQANPDADSNTEGQTTADQAPSQPVLVAQPPQQAQSTYHRDPPADETNQSQQPVVTTTTTSTTQANPNAQNPDSVATPTTVTTTTAQPNAQSQQPAVNANSGVNVQAGSDDGENSATANVSRIRNFFGSIADRLNSLFVVNLKKEAAAVTKAVDDATTTTTTTTDAQPVATTTTTTTTTNSADASVPAQTARVLAEEPIVGGLYSALSRRMLSQYLSRQNVELRKLESEQVVVNGDQAVTTTTTTTTDGGNADAQVDGSADVMTTTSAPAQQNASNVETAAPITQQSAAPAQQNQNVDASPVVTTTTTTTAAPTQQNTAVAQPSNQESVASNVETAGQPSSQNATVQNSTPAQPDVNTTAQPTVVTTTTTTSAPSQDTEGMMFTGEMAPEYYGINNAQPPANTQTSVTDVPPADLPPVQQSNQVPLGSESISQPVNVAGGNNNSAAVDEYTQKVAQLAQLVKEEGELDQALTQLSNTLPKCLTNQDIQKASALFINNATNAISANSAAFDAQGDVLANNFQTLKGQLAAGKQVTPTDVTNFLDVLYNTIQYQIETKLTQSDFDNFVAQLGALNANVDVAKKAMQSNVPCDDSLDQQFTELSNNLEQGIQDAQFVNAALAPEFEAEKKEAADALRTQFMNVDANSAAAKVQAISNNLSAAADGKFGQSINGENLKFIIHKTVAGVLADLAALRSNKKASGFVLDVHDVDYITSQVTQQLKAARQQRAAQITQLTKEIADTPESTVLQAETNTNAQVNAQNSDDDNDIAASATPGCSRPINAVANVVGAQTKAFEAVLDQPNTQSALSDLIAQYAQKWITYAQDLKPVTRNSNTVNTLASELSTNSNASAPQRLLAHLAVAHARGIESISADDHKFLQLMQRLLAEWEGGDIDAFERKLDATTSVLKGERTLSAASLDLMGDKRSLFSVSGYINDFKQKFGNLKGNIDGTIVQAKGLDATIEQGEQKLRSVTDQFHVTQFIFPDNTPSTSTGFMGKIKGFFGRRLKSERKLAFNPIASFKNIATNVDNSRAQARELIANYENANQSALKFKELYDRVISLKNL